MNEGRRRIMRARDLIFFTSYPEIFADEETIEKQVCGNLRCRGNVTSRCVYQPRQYNICGDKVR